MTVREHIRYRVGTARSGRFVDIADPGASEDWEGDVARAHEARFVSGHFGRVTFDRISAGAFAFTFLREPRARLRSHYRYYSALKDPRWHIEAESYLDFLTRDEPRFVHGRDNMMTRMLGAAYEIDDAARVPREEWSARADETLARMQFIGTQEEFDSDFDALLQRIDMPRRSRVKRRNVTSDMGKTGGNGVPPKLEIGEAELAAEDACLAMDLGLYDRWAMRPESART